MAIEIARRQNARLKLGVTGPSGSGKTMTSLFIALVLAAGKSIGLIDSEKGAASLYVGESGVPEFSRDTEFEKIESPTVGDYIASIARMAAAGIEVLIIDSMSHSWKAALEAVDRGGGWSKVGKTVTPQVEKLINSILTYPGHVICTIRSKTEHVIETVEGKVKMKKMGLAPQVRNDTEYEFTVMIDLDRDGTFTVSKSRCGDAIPMDETFKRSELPAMMVKARQWLERGAPVTPRSEALQRIRFASDEPTLLLAGAYINDQKLAGKLTPEDLEEIKTAYLAKKTQFADDVVPE